MSVHCMLNLVLPEVGGLRGGLRSGGPPRRTGRNPVLRFFIGVEGSGYRVYGYFRGLREAQEINRERA